MVRAAQIALVALLIPPVFAQTAPAKPAVSDRQAAYKLVTTFRRTQKPDERAALAKKILGYGRTGAAQFHNYLRYETDRRLKKYEYDIKRYTVSVQRRRRPPMSEVTKLRTQVTSLRNKAELSKEDITKLGTPAVTGLAELLLPPKDLVATGPDALKKARSLLEELLGYRAECEKLLGIEPVKADRLKLIEQNAAFAPLLRDKALGPVIAHNDRLASRIDPLEFQGVRDLNLTRHVLGLQPLKIDVALCKAARDHSKDMKEKGFFAHESPIPGKKTPWDRAKRAGTKARAENIFFGSTDPLRANNSWFHSPGHHKNMLNPAFTVIGLGRHEGHWTQMFR
jgi:hypothetical protein